MFPKPKPQLKPNTYAYESEPMVKATGFREYDARWLFGDEINLMGVEALGLGLGTLVHELGVKPELVTGHDFRSYSASIKMALTNGLIAAGCKVNDIGLALTPMAYFAQFDLDVPCVAMVTASHNDNGWTGVKMGANRPLTFGPDEIGRLKDIVLNGRFKMTGGGSYAFVENFPARYIADLTKRPKLKRRLRVVCACGNGTAGAFAPHVLEAVGCEVVPLDCNLDHTFPKYNPNTEDMKMLHAMRDAVLESKADVALGFDGDGDRCGVVDNEGEEIFADKVGVMLARDISVQHKNAHFVADVKSTGLFMTDPVLIKNGARTDYWKTGHSYMKRRVNEIGAIAGFEKSGHFFFNKPFGRAYHVAALRGRGEIRRGRRRGEAFREREEKSRQGCRPADPRPRHRQRCARHRGRRHLGPGARLIEQAGACRRGRKPGVGSANARHVQVDRRRAARAQRSGRV
jgi:phosphomannomutase / phosphoglucomutase